MNDTVTTDPITALRQLACSMEQWYLTGSLTVFTSWINAINSIADHLDDTSPSPASISPDPVAAIDAIAALNERTTEWALDETWIGLQPLMETMSVNDQVRVTRRYLTLRARMGRNGK